MNGIATISIRHNFETAHRLPFLGGKCSNWHGHSWQVQISIFNTSFDTGTDSQGISCEYGLIKSNIRSWIDKELDHGIMIGIEDKMLDNFTADGTKLFVFGQSDRGYGDYEEMPWPTVEAVAMMLGDKLQEVVRTIDNALFIDMVEVQETQVNSTIWQPSMTRQRSE